MFSELRVEFGLNWLSLSRLRLLRCASFGHRFVRHHLIAGIDALNSVAVRGAIIIGYVVNAIAADAKSAVHLLQ